MPYTDPQLAEMTAQANAGVPLASLTIPPAPVKKRRKNEESEMQRRICRWWGMACKNFDVPEVLLFKIANDGKRTPIGGRLDKLAGLRRGAPDLCLAVARPRYKHEKVEKYFERMEANSLYLELKTETGRVSAEQQTFHQHLRAAGYKVEIVRSFDQAVEVITGYLSK